jgi:hypothetical protein
VCLRYEPPPNSQDSYTKSSLACTGANLFHGGFYLPKNRQSTTDHYCLLHPIIIITAMNQFDST